MKKRILKAEDIPIDDSPGGQKTPFQDKIYEFIKKHPHCTRKDIYSIDRNEGHIREAITKMLKTNKLRETFTIR